MRTKKLLALLLCLSLTLSVILFTASCDKDDSTDDGNNETCSHKNTDGNKTCDICGEELPETVKLTVTVLDEQGNGVKDATVELSSGATVLTLGSTDANGKLTYVVKTGTYTVNVDNLPEYWYITNNYQEFDVNYGSESITFTAINNAPDGSADKPFFVGDGISSAVLPAGASYLYYATGSSRYLVINNAGVKVSCNGTDYTPDENGTVKLLLNAPESVYERLYFTVTNTLTTDNTFSLSFEYLPGTYDNPYSAELDTEVSASVPKDTSVYYKWIATESGKLRVSSSDTNNLIVLRSGDSVTESSDGAAYIEINVVKGSTIIIEVASKDKDSETDTIAFTLTLEESSFSQYETITVAEAKELCTPTETTERYYLRVFVKSISNVSYGEMIVYDSTGEIYVYGTYSSDGALKFPEIDDLPKPGDEIIIHCTLSEYNGTDQVKNARLIAVNHIEQEFDENEYTESTVADARESADDTKLIVEGVVAAITYANGKVPSGVILVDATGSIYVYDSYVAQSVKKGDTVKVAGAKAHWILDSEKQNAEKFGYKGACQITNATLMSKTEGTAEFDKTWIEETTVADIMNTPVNVDITTLLFKVTALIKKAENPGFTNYYINDIDGVTGSYVYTQCNGSDFAWLDAFDGKICTVYMTALNAKSTATGCNWRFIPVEVVDENYTFNTDNAPEYAVKYHGINQFLPEYTGDPALELITTVDSELLGFEGATLTYTSSNENVIKFTTADGKTVMNCLMPGKVTVTVTGAYADKAPYSYTITITVIGNEDVEYITVAEAIAAEEETEVTVKGIVGPSVVNRDAFYLFGEDGSFISVLVNDVNIFSAIEIGHEIIVSGKREHFVNPEKYNGNYVGQASIVNAEVVANFYGDHSYSTEKFVTGKSVEELYTLAITEDYSTTAFVVNALVSVEETGYYTSIKLKSTDGSVTISLYCSSANQYSWLKAFANKIVTLELAACNWNDKTYWAFCALAVVNEDGTKVLNTYNF